MTIKTLLVDDEPLAIAEFKAMLSGFAEIDIIATASDASSARRIIDELQPELLFLDIQMPGKSGFDLLEELDYSPMVVFVTAYDEYAIKAFEVNALDYLLKPINVKRLQESVEKIRRAMEAEQGKDKTLPLDKRVFIKDGEQCYFVQLSDIYLLESVGNYVKVYFQNHKPLLHKSLNYMEEKLPEGHFFRASRQHIININYIRNIYPFLNNALQAELSNGMKIDFSQRQTTKFKERMGI
jgi:two-component system, LytTR family, response regulator